MGLLMLGPSFARTPSVALLSHYASVAISLAMFALGLAGLLVYLRPGRFVQEPPWALLLGSATCALGFVVLTLAVSARRIAAPEQMRFAGER